MRRVCSLVAVSIIALASSVNQARAARLETPAPANNIAASAVTGLSLVPGEGRADVIIAVSGPVQVQDFTVPTRTASSSTSLVHALPRSAARTIA